ncbi:hypothetical protein CEXT_731011 [Caerostris extrusa]|uniref:Uncharacterized protein n=1 Tax=Caerostris extrusa TaxID=172846 RepID=A0AAV4YAE9_CAEEX|nr:hypothetical protein CEXT_731011 [Caerostris extrusa]
MNSDLLGHLCRPNKDRGMDQGWQQCLTAERVCVWLKVMLRHHVKMNFVISACRDRRRISSRPFLNIKKKLGEMYSSQPGWITAYVMRWLKKETVSEDNSLPSELNDVLIIRC